MQGLLNLMCVLLLSCMEFSARSKEVFHPHLQGGTLFGQRKQSAVLQRRPRGYLSLEGVPSGGALHYKLIDVSL